VKLHGTQETKEYGTVLLVSGADLLDGTPIYDIKPYLSFADSHPDAKDGFAEAVKEDHLTVEVSDELIAKVKEEKRDGLIAVLKGDPRPSYQEDPERIYGMKFADYEVFFKVSDCKLNVTNIEVLK
jgi:hypothetical protein